MIFILTFLLLFNTSIFSSYSDHLERDRLALEATSYGNTPNCRAERKTETTLMIPNNGLQRNTDDASCKEVCIPLAKKMCCACVCLTGFVVTALLLVEKEYDFFGNTTKED
jgi:hypothetical protein